MVIGVLQFEVLIPDAESLKDKRRVVSSLKDRLHREHQVSVAEVDRLESPGVGVLGLAVVGSDGARIGALLDRITHKLMSMTDARLGDVSRELLHGAPAPGASTAHLTDPAQETDFASRAADAAALDDRDGDAR